MRTDNNRYEDMAHLLPIVAQSMKRMFDPAYQIKKFLADKQFLETFIELVVAIEIINVCKGKKPGNEFVKLFQKSIRGKKMNSKQILMHLGTLFYFDKRKKLFKEVVGAQKFEQLSSSQIIRRAAKAVSNEESASLERLDSDAVKIKGGSKKAVIIPFESIENTYAAVSKIKDRDGIGENISKYVQASYRSDRARNIALYVDYIVSGKGTKVSNTDAARELGISRKSLHQIQNALKNDLKFRSLLKAYQKNNQ